MYRVCITSYALNLDVYGSRLGRIVLKKLYITLFSYSNKIAILFPSDCQLFLHYSRLEIVFMYSTFFDH